MYLFQHVHFQNINLLHTYYVITTYLVYKPTTFFSPILLQLFVRIIMSNTLSYDCNAWYRSWVKSQCMTHEPHEVGISLKCLKICFVLHVMLYGPNTDFFNIIHLSAIVRHVNYTFLHCFSTYLQLEMANICLDIDLCTYFFNLHMFLINHGCSDMACQMSSILPWGGISLIWFKNPFLQYVYFCMPQKHFFNIMHL